MIVDTQCHVSPVWFEPVESLIDQMDRNGVDRAVLIQMIGQTDNAYQQDCLRRFPRRFASVVWVDPQRPDAILELQGLAREGAVGVRLRPTARSAGADPLVLWREAERLGMTVSCVGNSVSFAASEFAHLVASLPGLTIVLEHLGGSSQPDGDDAARAQRVRVFELARLPNVYVKVPGLGELTARKQPPPKDGNPFEDGTPQVLQDALARFGATRLMWGSDFPPVGSREGYGNSLRLCATALAHLPQAERELIFGGVAERVFRLSDGSSSSGHHFA